MNRNLIQKNNITLGLLFKAIGMALNFLLVPILIIYLDKVEYGVWVTVFSIVNWIFTFDIGIGQGLRNKLTEALSLNDKVNASALISTSYVLMAIFALVILIIGSIIIFSTNFQEVLNYKSQENSFIQLFIFLSLVFTVINFILSLYKKLYLAIHKSYIIEMISSIFLSTYLISIFLLNRLDQPGNLISLIMIFGLLNIAVSITATILFFKTNKYLEISLAAFNMQLAKSLFGLGSNFFLINISLLIILSTDNIIISNMLGPAYVTDYSVVQKLYQLLIVGFSVVLAASWGLYSEAIAKSDYVWIIGNLKKMNFIFLAVFIVGLILFFNTDFILKLWLKETPINLPEGLVLGNLIYALMFCYVNIYFYFINATGKIKLQMYLYIIGAIVNIPLSIYLVGVFKSSTGVIISTIVCTLPLTIVMPIQTKVILSNFKKISSK
jgi:O-antigen/teichoic acid export membrane protein